MQDVVTRTCSGYTEKEVVGAHKTNTMQKVKIMEIKYDPLAENFRYSYDILYTKIAY